MTDIKGPEDIKLDDIFIWNKDCTAISVKIPKKGIYEYVHLKEKTEITCLKNDKNYKLQCLGGSWICSCLGYSYRRHCSHVDNIPKRIRKLVENETEKPKKGYDPIKEGAKNAFRQKWNPKTQKMEPIYKEDGSMLSAYDEFWVKDK